MIVVLLAPSIFLFRSHTALLSPVCLSVVYTVFREVVVHGMYFHSVSCHTYVTASGPTEK